MLGCITEYYFSRERFAVEMFLYVAPALRRSLASGRIARQLYERFRDWALSHEIREIRTGVSTGIAVEATHRFYVGMGMKHSGEIYSLEAPRAA
jgi:hypothetical protein